MMKPPPSDAIRASGPFPASTRARGPVIGGATPGRADRRAAVATLAGMLALGAGLGGLGRQAAAAAPAPTAAPTPTPATPTGGADGAASRGYPSQPITLIVPFAPGSGTDSVARIVSKGLGDRLGQPVLVDNRPGANGQVAAELAAAARPDGYTLMMSTNTAHSANPALYRHLRYDPAAGFTAITRVGELPFAVVVNPALPVTTLAGLIERAKASPGKFSYATPNSTSLVATETIERLAGIDLVGVPYRSSPQAMTDVVAGTVDLYVVDLASGRSMIQAGRVRPLATTNANGSPGLPGVPPVAATLTGFDLTSWNGILGPANLDPAIVATLDAAIRATLADPAIRERLAEVDFVVWPSESPAAFDRYLAEQRRHWASLVEAAGIPPQ